MSLLLVQECDFKAFGSPSDRSAQDHKTLHGEMQKFKLYFLHDLDQDFVMREAGDGLERKSVRQVLGGDGLGPGWIRALAARMTDSHIIVLKDVVDPVYERLAAIDQVLKADLPRLPQEDQESWKQKLKIFKPILEGSSRSLIQFKCPGCGQDLYANSGSSH